MWTSFGYSFKIVFTYEADPESGAIHIVEDDYRFDLTDIPAPLLDTLRECGVCMSDLEDKLVQEDVVYGAASMG